MNIKAIKTLNKISEIQAYFKLNKKINIKEGTKLLTISLAIFSPGLFIFINCCNYLNTAPHNLTSKIITCALGAILSFPFFAIPGIVILGSLIKLISFLTNNEEKSDFLIYYSNFDNLENYIDIKSIINLLLSVSLTKNVDNLIKLSTINQVELALNYNLALLQTMNVKDFPLEIKNKYDKNIELITHILANALLHIKKENLTENKRFIELLESTTLEDKIEFLNKHEELYQEQLMKSKKDIDEIEVQRKIKLQAIENQITQKLNPIHLTDTKNTVKTKEQQKYLSL
jgi:hypothetical protein